MSNTSTTPRLTASPAPPSLVSVENAPAQPSSASRPTKPTNVFSNDGSFLERFQRTKKEEEERKKEQESLLRKRQFDNRFKNRKKRRSPDDTPASGGPPDIPAEEVQPNKKPKSDKPLSDYEKQVQSYSGHGLKDNGTGVRPLVK